MIKKLLTGSNKKQDGRKSDAEKIPKGKIQFQNITQLLLRSAKQQKNAKKLVARWPSVGSGRGFVNGTIVEESGHGASSSSSSSFPGSSSSLNIGERLGDRRLSQPLVSKDSNRLQVDLRHDGKTVTEWRVRKTPRGGVPGGAVQEKTVDEHTLIVLKRGGDISGLIYLSIER